MRPAPQNSPPCCAFLDPFAGRKGQRGSCSAQAQVEFDKTIIRAGVAGRVEQFFLRVGDVVNPLMLRLLES